MPVPKCAAHARQSLGGPAGDPFTTQIDARQCAHFCRTDGTFGAGMSAILWQTTQIPIFETYSIGSSSCAGRLRPTNVADNPFSGV